MSIERYVVRYKDAEGNFVANIFDYYERYIKPLSSMFARYDWYPNKKIMCFLKEHDDKNASMGNIPDTSNPGGYIYHCFGCGKRGNVVDLHVAIERDYHHRHLNKEEAAKEVAKLFNIPLKGDMLENEDYWEYVEREQERLNKEVEMGYTLTELRKDLRVIRQKRIENPCGPASMAWKQELCLMMAKRTATIKHLIDYD